MSKPLTNNEIQVLQENLDLFGSPLNDADTQTSKTKRQTNSKARKPNRAKQTTSHVEPATTDMLVEIEKATPIPDAKADYSLIKYLAIRATSGSAAKERLENQGAQVINYALEKRDPALRNISDALLNLGLEYRLDNQTIHWVLIEDNLTTEEHRACSHTEIAFYADWFTEEKNRIRQLRGTAYLDACSLIAQKLL
ncbi:hypothetical protein [Pseudomaricurvus sp.]|uniref:hypothetical protein n=1 Tax=Pseudomaricurvus sp. TaxID=2004510 RepID=UPI003F6D3330